MWKLLLLLLLTSVASTVSVINSSNDASALLDFKSKADLHNRLHFFNSSSLHFCRWLAVQCSNKSDVIRLVIQDLPLSGGIFAPNTLTRLHQLRVLGLQNLSLSGPLPNLSGLFNLKTLFLDRNSFSGSLPPSLSLLKRIRTLDLSRNNLSGSLPSSLNGLNKIYYLHLEFNRFVGPVPALNQSALRTFNVSVNNLTGVVPVTATLLRFGPESFSRNPFLCGEIVRVECHPNPPFFRRPAPAPARPLGLRAGEGVDVAQPKHKKRNRTAVIAGFSAGVFVLVVLLFICFVVIVKKQKRKEVKKKTEVPSDDVAEAAVAVQEELERKVKNVQGIQVVKSGSLLFCAGEAQVYSLDQLMRASAELLGRGTLGSTYKAVLDNRLIVCVKRLDAGALEGTGRDVFERHLETVGGLRHPNLVPLRAYFQAKEERLLIYDYQPNGSLFSLIHGKYLCFRFGKDNEDGGHRLFANNTRILLLV